MGILASPAGGLQRRPGLGRRRPRTCLRAFPRRLVRGAGLLGENPGSGGKVSEISQVGLPIGNSEKSRSVRTRPPTQGKPACRGLGGRKLGASPKLQQVLLLRGAIELVVGPEPGLFTACDADRPRPWAPDHRRECGTCHLASRSLIQRTTGRRTRPRACRRGNSSPRPATATGSGLSRS
jgi:hypothetical protein